jgi:hypothetical protein
MPRSSFLFKQRPGEFGVDCPTSARSSLSAGGQCIRYGEQQFDLTKGLTDAEIAASLLVEWPHGRWAENRGTSLLLQR